MKGSNALLFLGLLGGAGFIVYRIFKPTLKNPATPTYMLQTSMNEEPLDTSIPDWFLSPEYR
jgi:hypothetical protein